MNAYRLGSIYASVLDEVVYASLQSYLEYPPATVNVKAFNRVTMFQDGNHIYITRYKKMSERNYSLFTYCKQRSTNFAQI